MASFAMWQISFLTRVIYGITVPSLRLGKIPIEMIRARTAVEIMILLMFVKQAQRFVSQTVVLTYVLLKSCHNISVLFRRHQFFNSSKFLSVYPSHTSPFLYLYFLLLNCGLVNPSPWLVKSSLPPVFIKNTALAVHVHIV